MERQKVVREKASHVAEIGYDSATQTLEIAFTSGAVYDYSGVPQSLYDEFIKADSLGSFVATRIRGEFEYKRIHDEGCGYFAGGGCAVPCTCWCHKLTKTSHEEKPNGPKKEPRNIPEDVETKARKKKLRTGI